MYWYVMYSVLTVAISHCNQILENVLLALTTVRNCVWNWMEDMSVIVFQMDMS